MILNVVTTHCFSELNTNKGLTTMGYKTVSWTIKNPEVISVLEPHTGFNKHPQGYIRQCLYDAGVVSINATKMMPQTNFPTVELGQPIKISFYDNDHYQLKQRAEQCGLKIQQLLEFVLLNQPTFETT